jgi:hypothetical protein
VLANATPTTLSNDISTRTISLDLSLITCYSYEKKGHYKSKYLKVVVRMIMTKEAIIDDPLTLT